MTLAWNECGQAYRIPERALPGTSSAFGRLYIFGGVNSESLLGDLQVWDPLAKNWTNLTKMNEAAPSPRVGHGLAAIESFQKLYMFGGIVRSSGTDSLSSEFYEFDLVTSSWKNISQLCSSMAPRAFFGFTAASNKLYVFGGFLNGFSMCDLYQFDPSVSLWTCVTSNGTAPKANYILSGMTALGSKIFVFGGFASEGTHLRKLHFTLLDR